MSEPLASAALHCGNTPMVAALGVGATNDDTHTAARRIMSGTGSGSGVAMRRGGVKSWAGERAEVAARRAQSGDSAVIPGAD